MLKSWTDEPLPLVTAPEAVVCRAHYVIGEGWSLTWKVRRSCQLWEDVRAEEYSRLTTVELAQVLERLGDQLLR